MKLIEWSKPVLSTHTDKLIVVDIGERYDPRIGIKKQIIYFTKVVTLVVLDSPSTDIRFVFIELPVADFTQPDEAPAYMS